MSYDVLDRCELVARIRVLWCERFARNTASASVAAAAGRIAEQPGAINATEH